MTNRHVDQIAKAAIVPGVRSGHIAAAQSGAIIRARRSRGALEYSNLMTSPVPEITVRGGYFRVTGSSHLRDTNPVLIFGCGVPAERRIPAQESPLDAPIGRVSHWAVRGNR
jgi:hypothetical protein